MSYPKKPSGAAIHTIAVDDETFDQIEKLRTKKETKGEAIKRLIYLTKVRGAIKYNNNNLENKIELM